jgi:hypothetical protein
MWRTISKLNNLSPPLAIGMGGIKTTEEKG